MLKSFFFSAMRNLKRDKLVTIINLFGMSVALASALVIFIYVKRELRFDKTSKADNLYRVEFHQISDQSPKWPVVPHFWADRHKDRLPEIVNHTAIRKLMGVHKILVGETVYDQENVIISSPGILDMFDLKLVGATSPEPLTGRKKVMLSKELSETYFGQDDPVGQFITINGEDGFLVTGVFELTTPLHMKFEVIQSVDETIQRSMYYWLHTYLELQPGVDANELIQKANAMADELNDPFFSDTEYRITPFEKIYFETNAEYQIAEYGDRDSVYIFIAVGFMILLTAALNFINLTAASFINRMKELSVRKVLGSTRAQTIVRLFCEAGMVVLMAFVVGIILAQGAIPMANQRLNLELELNVLSESLVIWFGLLFMLIALASSLYAAFMPQVLTASKSGKQKRNPLYKNVAILFQLSISMFLIIGVLLVKDQLSFMKNKDLGFGNDPVYMIKILNPQLQPRLNELADRLENNPDIISTAAMMGSPGHPQLMGNQNFWGEGMDQGESIFMNFYAGDESVVETLGLNLIMGQDFSQGVNLTPGTEGIILNQSAANEFGWEDPVGKRMTLSGAPAVVVGVVEDFHFQSLQNQITPTAIVYNYNLYIVAVRMKAEAVKSALDFVNEQWEIIAPDTDIDAFFLEESFNEQYAHEEKLELILGVLTVLALAISAVGTLGMMMLMIKERTKEIGIRKVLGANWSQLLLLLNRRVFMLLIIGNVITMPVAYYLSQQWLSGFAYSTRVNVLLLVVAGLVTAVMALLAPGYHSVKAVVRNPVDTLRDE